MTRTLLATLTALSLTLIAAQANAAAYIKYEGVPGVIQATGADRPATGADSARGGRGIIIIDMATGNDDRGPDSDAGRDGGRDAGRDAFGG
jgi:hypothetical protein